MTEFSESTGFSTTAAPEPSVYQQLQKVADKYAELIEWGPLALMLRQQVSERVHLRTLSLYKLAGEP